MQNGQWQVYLSGEIHTDWRDQIADGAVLLQLMTQRRVFINGVVVTAPFAGALNDAPIFQFADDPRDSSLRDPDHRGDLA